MDTGCHRLVLEVKFRFAELLGHVTLSRRVVVWETKKSETFEPRRDYCFYPIRGVAARFRVNVYVLHTPPVCLCTLLAVNLGGESTGPHRDRRTSLRSSRFADNLPCSL